MKVSNVLGRREARGELATCQSGDGRIDESPQFRDSSMFLEIRQGLL